MRHNKKPISLYVLVIYVITALLLSQTFKMHAHTQHDDSNSHAVNAHIAFSQHDTLPGEFHQDEFDEHYHSSEVEIGNASIVKKTQLLNPFAMLLFIVILVLFTAQICLHQRRQQYKTEKPTNYYLLSPPLRAPPQ